MRYSQPRLQAAAEAGDSASMNGDMSAHLVSGGFASPVHGLDVDPAVNSRAAKCGQVSELV